MTHELKTVSPYWEAITSGIKKFEIRYDKDRCFQQGDTVIFRHYDEEFHSYITNDKNLQAKITYVCHYEQKEGWCVFGFKNLKPAGEKTIVNCRTGIVGIHALEEEQGNNVVDKYMDFDDQLANHEERIRKLEAKL